MAASSDIINTTIIADCVDRFRAKRPHVHCITNSVAQHFTANVLLAAGGRASMTIAKDEVLDFVNMADALLINLGTMDAERSDAVRIAVDTATSGNTPWALDPVFVQASPGRLTMAHSLLKLSPSVIRCNAGEAKALLEIEADANQLTERAKQHSTTIALTGASDLIANADGAISIENGSPVMDRITAMGCALTALVIGFAAIEKNHLLAVTSAIGLFGLAGDVAEEKSDGPGTFVPHFLDALQGLTRAEIESGVRLQ